MGRQLPVQCSKCRSEFLYELARLETDGVITCPGCGHTETLPEEHRAAIRRELEVLGVLLEEAAKGVNLGEHVSHRGAVRPR